VAEGTFLSQCYWWNFQFLHSLKKVELVEWLKWYNCPPSKCEALSSNPSSGKKKKKKKKEKEKERQKFLLCIQIEGAEFNTGDYFRLSRAACIRKHMDE
jgi:hypothetical protein